jgi:hypothetical protein
MYAVLIARKNDISIILCFSMNSELLITLISLPIVIDLK